MGKKAKKQKKQADRFLRKLIADAARDGVMMSEEEILFLSQEIMFRELSDMFQKFLNQAITEGDTGEWDDNTVMNRLHSTQRLLDSEGPHRQMPAKLRSRGVAVVDVLTEWAEARGLLQR